MWRFMLIRMSMDKWDDMPMFCALVSMLIIIVIDVSKGKYIENIIFLDTDKITLLSNVAFSHLVRMHKSSP